jgi:hypothetical protein
MREPVRCLIAVLPLTFVHAGPALAQPGHWPFPGMLGVERGRIGLEVQPMTAELRAHLGAPEDRGLLVVRIAPDRPAARAGVRVGDVLLEAGGAALEQPFDLVKAVARPAAGEAVELVLLRDRKRLTLSVVPEGEATPWVDPDAWRGYFERGVRQGREELQRRLEELEKRLRELERRVDEQQST